MNNNSSVNSKADTYNCQWSHRVHQERTICGVINHTTLSFASFRTELYYNDEIAERRFSGTAEKVINKSRKIVKDSQTKKGELMRESFELLDNDQNLQSSTERELMENWNLERNGDNARNYEDKKYAFKNVDNDRCL